MFSLIEAAILSPPYKGEAALAFQRFVGCCVQVFNGNKLFGSGFMISDEFAATSCTPRYPSVKFLDGRLIRAGLSGPGPYHLEMRGLKYPTPDWRYAQPIDGDIVFLLGFRDGSLTLSWGEITKGNPIQDCELEADGCVVVSRIGYVIGMVAGYSNNHYRCWRLPFDDAE